MEVRINTLRHSYENRTYSTPLHLGPGLVSDSQQLETYIPGVCCNHSVSPSQSIRKSPWVFIRFDCSKLRLLQK